MTVLTRAMQDGFALGALLAEDRELRRVAGAISPELAAAVRARVHADHKTKLLRELLEHVRPPLARVPVGLPAYGAALLATRVARPARSAAPPARAGYVPPEGLLPVLLRLARGQACTSEEAP